jgi:hypothetical protein
MSSYYIGEGPDSLINSTQTRYFYGLRRSDQGELFLGKADQLKKTDSITINKAGDPDQNFPGFEEGQNFFEGRDVYHEKVYENLNFEQYRWDNKNLWYYINDDGELVLSVNQKHTYDETDSSNGI